MALPAADDHLLRQSAGLLGELPACHGIGSIQLGADASELVITVEEGRTCFDVAAFEAEAEVVLGHQVNVTSSGAPGAHCAFRGDFGHLFRLIPAEVGVVGSPPRRRGAHQSRIVYVPQSGSPPRGRGV